MRVARINKIDCMQCDACVDICPVQAIHTDENGDYEVDYELCQEAGGWEGCGLCKDVCAVDAIEACELENLEEIKHVQN